MLHGNVVHSGSPFRLLLQDKRFNGKFTEFAAQGMQCSAEHAQFVTDAGHRVVWLSKVLGRGAGGVAAGQEGKSEFECAQAAFRDVLDASPGHVFVSFDIDSIRSSDCPGVSCPATVGLSADIACRLCFMAGADRRVAMVDVSELNPEVEGYRSPRLVAFMFYHFLLGLAHRKVPPRS